jgi:hypothetical protein
VAKKGFAMKSDRKHTIPNSDRADAYFDYIRATNPPAFQVWLAANESEFQTAVEGALELYVSRLEAGARFYQQLGEIALSFTLSNLFCVGGVPTTSETYHNGHVDIVITHPTLTKLLMLGECKIYGGYGVHLQGCTQLLKRYMSGRAMRGFCLDFFKTPGMYEKLAGLRSGFDTQKPLEQMGVAKAHTIKGAFLTVHVHFTGSQTEILHVGCNVFHPEV